MASNGKWDWFAFYPKDFLTDEKVIVMSAMECGAYVRLLCVAWNSHPIGTLIASDEALYKYATLSREEWDEHKERIMAPFVLKGDRWHQKRMVEEGRAAEEKHLKFVAAGRLGGNTKWGNSEAIATLEAGHKPGSTNNNTVTIKEKPFCSQAIATLSKGKLSSEQVEGIAHPISAKFSNKEATQAVVHWYNYLHQEHSDKLVSRGELEVLVNTLARYSSSQAIIDEIEEAIGSKRYTLNFRYRKGKY